MMIIVKALVSIRVFLALLQSCIWLKNIIMDIKCETDNIQNNKGVEEVHDRVGTVRNFFFFFD